MRLSNPNAAIRVANKLDREQRDFLEDRIRALKEKRFDRYISDAKLLRRAPVHIRRAAARVDRFYKSERAADAARNNAWMKLENKIREEILFGDVRKALAMIRGA